MAGRDRAASSVTPAETIAAPPLPLTTQGNKLETSRTQPKRLWAVAPRSLISALQSADAFMPLRLTVTVTQALGAVACGGAGALTDLPSTTLTPGGSSGGDGHSGIGSNHHHHQHLVSPPIPPCSNHHHQQTRSNVESSSNITSPQFQPSQPQPFAQHRFLSVCRPIARRCPPAAVTCCVGNWSAKFAS